MAAMAEPYSGGAASEKENDIKRDDGMMLPKMKIPFFRAMASLSLAAAMVSAAAPVWETDLEQALKEASRSGRSVLVDFTGSDWCPGCIHLRKNIFDTEAFAKYAEENKTILVELDFPRSAGKMPPEQLRRHEDLMRQYGVTAFPTVLLMEGDGSPYAGIVGATREKEEYLQKLDAAGKLRLRLKETLGAAGKLEGAEKREKLVEAMKLLPENLQPYQQGLITEIISVDPEDKYGFAKKREEARVMAEQRLMMQRFYEKHQEAFASRNLGKSRDEALDMLDGKDLLPAIRLEISKYVSDSYALERNFSKALEYLEKARDADPESSAAKKLEPWIDNMKKHMNEWK